MPKKIELLSIEGTTAANDAFMFIYQRSILLSLEKEGLINTNELDECLIKLDEQSSGQSSADHRK